MKQVVDVRMAKPSGDRPKGFAHIEFGNRESLVLALGFNRVELQGRSLKLDVADTGMPLIVLYV
jgi:RNA recognition motif-containing protein